jgi:hypothetical protein
VKALLSNSNDIEDIIVTRLVRGKSSLSLWRFFGGWRVTYISGSSLLSIQDVGSFLTPYLDLGNIQDRPPIRYGC